MRIRALTFIAMCLALTAAQADDLRDPMRPAGAPTAARPAPVYSLKLEGVIAGEKRVAIINGRLVRAGDTIAGARILEILAHGVRYERAGKIQNLTLAVPTANTSVRVARSRPEEVSSKETRP
jgi:MSHA biogenesis protein MshK